MEAPGDDPAAPIDGLHGLNDAYIVMSWLAFATIFLAMTLPGASKRAKEKSEAANKSEDEQPVVEPQPTV